MDNKTAIVLFVVAGALGLLWYINQSKKVVPLTNLTRQPVRLSSGVIYNVDPAYNDAGY